MQFLNPIWLFGIAAVSIPVIIHLWNIKQHKTLKVGSVSLINSSSRQRSRSFKINDILLFILRSLLLLVLAFLLATPVWQHAISNTKAKGWILISPENLKETYGHFKPAIDSLIAAGFEPHYFNQDFKQINLSKSLADKSLHEKNKVENYWTLITLVGKMLPANIPVFAFTPDEARYFSGKRPTVPLNLHWNTYTRADSVTTWIQSAWFTNNNAIRVTEGISRPSGTSFTNYVIQSEGDQKSPFTLTVNNGNPVINLKNNAEQAVSIDTTTRHIAIYTDHYRTDAGYLQAALLAVNNFTQQKNTIKVYNDAKAIPAGQHWLFWLSEKAMDSSIISKATHVFKYEQGKVIGEASSILIDRGYALSNQQDLPALYKRISSDTITGHPVWRDGFGNPILTVSANQGGSLYRFYSRFNPGWNELVWNSGFATDMLKLTSSTLQKEDLNAHDKTKIDNQELMPGIINPSVSRATANNREAISLYHYFWLLLVWLFLAERWVAHKKKEGLSND